MNHINRRTFIISSSSIGIFTVVTGCFYEVLLSKSDKETLLKFAKLLFPHDNLEESVYLIPIEALLDKASEDDDLDEALRNGIKNLHLIVNGNFDASTFDDQIKGLKRIELDPFFTSVHESVRKQLYEQKEVWDLIGYEGPSAELGGYINRGFDDIDWLPNN